ncbi:DUF2119 domain-containing protein [Methanococcus maripaludis]|uniref:Conserved hypothetical archaeal protein n=1 Tax=Methanococcus maripaludis (strain DSM 14266 / JCM 13030 / NBRC 101832 / S2 / LL) TaxID=267377 RepID=Q6LXP0_METMP|nr:DUF2119 domain-containing protein [Methanococcus maripaludis]CAF30865.1 conserved hypothetical archaeal protein [Methanococcus maripaludis S2]
MKIYNNFENNVPKKLFLAGIHGNESKYTSQILENLQKNISNLKASGNVIIVPELVKDSKYYSTLNPKYYETEEGISLLKLIEKYNPEFYFEIHSYSKKSYSNLTELKRVDLKGIPPFVDLNKGVLMASISPILREKFKETDFCMTIEVPNWKVLEVEKQVLEILEFGILSKNRNEMIEKIFNKYPKAAKTAKWLADEFNLTFL